MRGEWKQVWKKARIFKGLDEGYVDLFSDDSMIWPFEEGEVIIQQGTYTDHIYIVEVGSVAVVKEDDPGHQTELVVLGSGEVFGEMSLVLDSTTTASIIGKDAGSCLMIHKLTFEKVLRNNERIAAVLWKNISRILAERLKVTSQKAEDLDEELQKVRVQGAEHTLQ